ncbi:ribonuclease P protein subunit p29 isoform X2 [Protopterus annectens]|uniref:ribonuclease P protein subunit p29 isoform X2 n=1 Tax=Protopterus annectens TaxID=7888 RepID=UPI001CFA1584|nr:ribonuclease P protein subunit p29 isoform X2 [Protopterus annectens]
MNDLTFSKLPAEEAKHFGIKPQSSEKATAFVNTFLKRCMPKLSSETIQEKLNRKALVLNHSLKKEKKKRKTKSLSAKERQEMKIFEIKPEQQRYELFLPLHELWKQYIRDLCGGLKPNAQPLMVQSKLLKADFHGALITVIPKSNSVFSVEIDGFVSYIYGSKFQFRASERSARKFKVRGSMDL